MFQIALLRGINVSGHNRVAMRDLVSIFTALGLRDVETHLQSGNVVFKTSRADGPRLEKRIAESLRTRLGFPVPVLLLTRAELAAVSRRNPFLRSKTVAPDHLYVTFLSAEPSAPALAQVNALRDPVDGCVALGKAVYLHCPNGYGRTKLNNAFLERTLRVTATTRNWRTVTTLLRLTGDGPNGPRSS